MSTDDFYEEREEQSRIKTEIVEKYFEAWANVMLNYLKKDSRHSTRIAYIDLFAGPGRYKDGTPSTPIHIIERAMQNEDLRKNLVIILNDKNPEYVESLHAEVELLLKKRPIAHKPQIMNEEVGDKLVAELEQTKLIPTLSFIDPWGYKGLSTRLFGAVIKDWGCDCVFFFNYNRINAALSKHDSSHHLEMIFGDERASQLRREVADLSAGEREVSVMRNLELALKAAGGEYQLLFAVRKGKSARTSHYIVFMSKNFRGYHIMKNIMAGSSSGSQDWMPSLEFDALRSSRFEFEQFDFAYRSDELRKELLRDFSGRSLTMWEVYEQHSKGTPYLERNYKDVLRMMEENGDIVANPPAAERPKRYGKTTFGPSVMVRFPSEDS